MHSKNNISKGAALMVAALFFLSFTPQNYELKVKDWQKIEKKTKTTFNIKSVNFSALTLTNPNEKSKFWKIEEVGYLVIGQAPSKFHQFEYFILFNNNGDVLYVEVLNYREHYGAEICNKRWLQQFKNITTTSIFEFNSSVDGISGATISVNSLKKDVLKLSNVLKKKIK